MGRSATPSGSSTRASAARLALLVVQGVLLTELAPRRRYRVAGRIVRREGSVLYESSRGACRARRARFRCRATRTRTGRFWSTSDGALGVAFAVRRAPIRSAPTSRRSTRAERARGTADAGVQPPDGSTQLAAGVESVGAMEMGFHVSGSAAGEGHGRSQRAAVAAWRDPVEAGVIITAASTQRTPGTQRKRPYCSVSFSVSLVSFVLMRPRYSAQAQRRAAADHAAASARRRRASRSRCRCRKACTPNRTSRAIRC